MATIKENVKGIKSVQALFLQKKTDIKKSDLTNLGFDATLGKFEIRNLKAEKSLFDRYSLSVIDKYRDLDGKLISENKNLIHRINTLWSAGKKEIPFSDLWELNIYSPASELKIGNILLSNYLGFANSYSISLINSDKNIDNKWLDSSVTMNKVLDALINFPYDKKMLALAEVPLNKEFEKYFKEHFESVKKSDTSNKGLIDLTIGNDRSKIAIELKLSRKLKLANESQKCRGQIEDYKKQFGSNLILVIAGEKEDRQEKFLQECNKKAENLGIRSYFMEVKKW